MNQSGGTQRLSNGRQRSNLAAVRRGLRRLRAATGMVLLLVTAGQVSAADMRPSVLLHGATLDQARSFAVETTTSRGWTIRSVGPYTAVFEQALDSEDDDDTPVVLRVFADFSEESSGIRVFLRGEEIASPDSAEEAMTDVTRKYSDNLANALSSLRAKWDSAQEQQPNVAGAYRPGDMGSLASHAVASGSNQIGVWAYAAEQYAKSRGCQPGDKPTNLEASGKGLERHRVYCTNGTELLVDCNHGDCTTPR